MTGTMPSVLQWRIFITCVETGSFAAAARMLRADASGVSRQMDALEASLGVTLLVRTRNGVKATWSGERYYREIRPVVAEIDDLFGQFSACRNKDVFRVAVPSELAFLFVRWISEFEESCPGGAEIEFIRYERDEAPAVDGFDLFVCLRSLPDARVVARALGSVLTGIVASAAFLQNEELVRDPEELTQRPVLSLSPETVLTNGAQSLSLMFAATRRTNNVLSLAELAKLSRGYAVGVPLWVLQFESQRGNLKRVLPQWQCPSEPVWLLRSEREYRDRRIRELSDFLALCWKETLGLRSA